MVYRGCRIYRGTTDQAISDSANTLMAWTHTTHDITALHSVSVNNSRITIPSGYDGTYRIHAQIRWEADATGLRTVRLLKNGSTIAEVTHDAETAVTVMSIADTQTLVAGDYIEVQVYQDSGGSLDVLLGSALTYFNIDLLGA